MDFFNKEINTEMCIKCLMSIFAFIIIVIILSAYEMLIPKRFNRDIKISDSDEYVVNIENLNSSRTKLSISGYAFKGSDAIETGKGNDTVYFEGTEFGLDQVTSKAGSTMLKFVEDGDTAASKISDFFFTLEGEPNNTKTANLGVQYKQGEINNDESGVTFKDYYNIRSGKTKTLYLDSDTDGIYTVSTSTRAKATVASTRYTGKTKIYGQNYVKEYHLKRLLKVQLLELYLLPLLVQ